MNAAKYAGRAKRVAIHAFRSSTGVSRGRAVHATDKKDPAACIERFDLLAPGVVETLSAQNYLLNSSSLIDPDLKLLLSN